MPKTHASSKTALTGLVTSVTGTTNRITSTGGTTPVIDISSTYDALFVKVDGTVPLTGNWNMGAFSATFTKTGATAATLYDGFVLSNTTTASSGNQMYSGVLHFSSRGWATGSGGSSQLVEWKVYGAPVQGTTNPTGNLAFDSSINGGAFTNVLNINSAGFVGIGTAAPQNQLQIDGTTGSYSRLNVTTANGQAAYLFAKSGTNKWQFGMDFAAAGTADFYIYDQANGKTRFYISTAGTVFIGGTASAASTAIISVLSTGNVSVGNVTPTARLHIAAGTATAGSAPFKLTSGTNLTTGEAGALEYNGTNLFFTRSGTTREGVLTQSAVTTEVVVTDTSVTINIGGTTYKLLAKS